MRPRDHRVELLSAVELRNQLAELGVCAFVVRELDESEAAFEANVPAELLVLGEFERARIEIDDGALRPASPRSLGR